MFLPVHARAAGRVVAEFLDRRRPALAVLRAVALFVLGVFVVSANVPPADLESEGDVLGGEGREPFGNRRRRLVRSLWVTIPTPGLWHRSQTMRITYGAIPQAFPCEFQVAVSHYTLSIVTVDGSKLHRDNPRPALLYVSSTGSKLLQFSARYSLVKYPDQ